MKYLFPLLYALCMGLPSLTLIKLGADVGDVVMVVVGFAALMSVAVFVNSYIAEEA